MDVLAFEHHLTSPQGQGHVPRGAHTVTAGGSACCDEVTFSVAVTGDRSPTPASRPTAAAPRTAAGSAAVTLVRGADGRSTPPGSARGRSPPSSAA